MKFRRKYIDWAITVALIILLIIPATRVELLGGIQRIMLMTGLMNADTEEDPEIPQGNMVYALPLRDLEGNTFQPKELVGKTVFINFWATWCPPCVAEMPDIHELYESLDKEKFVFLMVSLDQKPEKAGEFVKRKGFTFPIYFPTGSFPDVYAHEVIPTSFVISPEGKVVFRQEGLASYNTEAFRTFLQNL